MNPVLLELGGFELRWYSVLVLLAVVLGGFLFQREAKRFSVKTDFVFNMAFWAIIFGLLGARLYYVIFQWEYYSMHLNEIYQIWNGGIAIHGAIIAGLIAVVVYCKKYQARTVRYVDFAVVALVIAQALGRWGNFFNSEAYGAVTTAEKLNSFLIPKFVVEGMKIDGVYYTPTFFYESIGCLILFMILLVIRRGKYTKVGTPTGWYLVGYGLIRFFIEASRTDSLMLVGFKMAQLASVVMIIIGLIMLMINGKKSKFEDLYNDKNNVDVIQF